jgi:hypothetical protein
MLKKLVSFYKNKIKLKGNLIGRVMVILNIFKIASSKWKSNISFNIAQLSSRKLSKLKLGLSEFSEVYLNETVLFQF